MVSVRHAYPTHCNRMSFLLVENNVFETQSSQMIPNTL